MPDWRVNALEGIYKFSAAYLMQKRYQILADYATHDLDTRELSRVNRYFFFTSACIRQYDWTIEQCCLHIRVSFGGKRTELRFECCFQVADETHNEHVLKPFFKVIRKSLYHKGSNAWNRGILKFFFVTERTLLNAAHA